MAEKLQQRAAQGNEHVKFRKNENFYMGIFAHRKTQRVSLC